MVETRDEQMQAQMRQRLHELQLEHRDLDTAIHRIADDPSHDQLALTRMKRRKLLLKDQRSEEHTSELQSQSNLVCRLLLEKKKRIRILLRHHSHRDTTRSTRI